MGLPHTVNAQLEFQMFFLGVMQHLYTKQVELSITIYFQFHMINIPFHFQMILACI